MVEHLTRDQLTWDELMEKLSQTERQQPRPWTVQDQIIAEVAAACGVSLREIGRVIGRSHVIVRRHLSRIAFDSDKKSNQRYVLANRQKILARARAYRRANADKIREKNLRYRLANADKVRERKRRWRTANIERLKDYISRWRANNPNRNRDLARRWREQNPERFRDATRKWVKANRERVSEYGRRRRALKRCHHRCALNPLDVIQVSQRFAIWDNQCAYCGVLANDARNNGLSRLTVDHVLALKHGGLDESFNAVPACHSCNSSKQESPVEYWYRQQQWFTEARWAKIRRHCPSASVGQLALL